jgi:hypothetical protein
MTDRSEEPDITEAGRSAVSDDRFNWLEYPNDDFPYYNGRPVRISGPQWWFVMLMTAIGFLALVAPIPFIPGAIGQFIRAILFFAIPLAGSLSSLSATGRRYFGRSGDGTSSGLSVSPCLTS